MHHRPRYTANRVRRTVSGPMWHGSAVNELLSSVTHADAVTRPIAGAHSIWELVLHMTVWAEIARERVLGRSFDDPTSVHDFPLAPARPSARSWAGAQQRLTRSHEQLADTVLAMTDEAWSKVLPDRTHTVGDMIDGVIEHSTYHGGQIALLKRALLARAEG